MIVNEHVRVRTVARSQVRKSETEAAGHDRVRAKLIAEPPTIDTGSPVQICQAHCLFWTEIVIETRLTIRKAKHHWRLIAKINSVQDVLQVTLAEIREP